MKFLIFVWWNLFFNHFCGGVGEEHALEKYIYIYIDVVYYICVTFHNEVCRS